MDGWDKDSEYEPGDDGTRGCHRLLLSDAGRNSAPGTPTGRREDHSTTRDGVHVTVTR